MVRTTGLKDYSDIHFTDRALAKKIIQFYQPSGNVLEPFKGDGAFYDPLHDYLHVQPQAHTLDWSEIKLGRNFLTYNRPVDWIITNPPFGPLTEMMKKAFEICQNTVFLIPVSKFFSSAPRLKLSAEHANLKHMLHVGTGRDIGFDIGFPFAAMHFEKGYHGPIHQTWLADINPAASDQALHDIKKSA